MNKDSAENKQFVCMKNPIGKDLVLEKNDFWTCNGWTIIAGIEFILIIIVLLFKRRNSKFEKLRNLKREISGKEVDFTNILNSAFNYTRSVLRRYGDGLLRRTRKQKRAF